MSVGVGRWVVWVPIRLWWAIFVDRLVLWGFFYWFFFFFWLDACVDLVVEWEAGGVNLVAQGEALILISGY